MLDALRNHTPTPATGVPVLTHPLPAQGRHRAEVLGDRGWIPTVADRSRRQRRQALCSPVVAAGGDGQG